MGLRTLAGLSALVALAGIVAHAGPTYESVVMSHNPVGYWRFEEASTALPAADTATDDGTQNGSYNGTATLVPGIVGQGVAVSPTGGGGGWVQASSIPSGQDLTVEVWVQSDTANWNAKGWPASARVNNGFIFHPWDGSRNWSGYVMNSTAGHQQISTWGPPGIQAWHHYALTYDGATGTGIMYFDGYKVRTNAGMNRARNATGIPTVWFGRDSAMGGSDREGDGSLDEAAIYTTALDGFQLRAHYQAAHGQPFVTGGRFTGASDLDFEGVFPFAIDVGDTSGNTLSTIGHATFTGEAVPGVSIASDRRLASWGVKPEYGSSPEDNALENLMPSIRYDSVSTDPPDHMDIDLTLPTMGFPYKLQLLFSENDPNISQPERRSFDLYIEGVHVLDEFDILDVQGSWSGTPTAGAVVVYEFWPTDDVLNIDFYNGSLFSNKDALLNALTLELVLPEPGTLGLLAVGGAWRGQSVGASSASSAGSSASTPTQAPAAS